MKKYILGFFLLVASHSYSEQPEEFAFMYRAPNNTIKWKLVTKSTPISEWIKLLQWAGSS